LSLLPKVMDSAEARAMILSVALQETKLLARRQYEHGPARGFCQWEPGAHAAIAEVFLNRASGMKAVGFCEALTIVPSVSTVYEAVEYSDILCAGFARLLLWASPKPLPGPNDPQAGWDLYYGQWRPGRPHRDSWEWCFSTAWATVAPTLPPAVPI
jgi:hypothetical protein